MIRKATMTPGPKAVLTAVLLGAYLGTVGAADPRPVTDKTPVPTLIDELDNGQGERRAAAADALFRVAVLNGDEAPKVRKALLEALARGQPQPVARSMVLALCEYGLTEPAVPVVVEALRTADRPVQVAVAAALRQYAKTPAGRKQVRDALLALLDQKEPVPVRARAALAAAEAGFDDPELFQAISAGTEFNRSRALRDGAIAAFEASEKPARDWLLKTDAENKFLPEVGSPVVTLRDLIEAHPGAAKYVFARDPRGRWALLELVAAQEKVSAADLVKLFPPHGAMDSDVRPDTWAAHRAVKVLRGAVPHIAATKPADAAKGDERQIGLQVLLTALDRCGPAADAAAGVVTPLLTDTDVRVRYDAAMWLARHPGDASAIEPLIKLLQTTDQLPGPPPMKGRIVVPNFGRYSAAEALAAYGAKANAALGPLGKVVNDPDLVFRPRVAYALCEIRDDASDLARLGEQIVGVYPEKPPDDKKGEASRAGIIAAHLAGKVRNLRKDHIETLKSWLKPAPAGSTAPDSYGHRAAIALVLLARLGPSAAKSIPEDLKLPGVHGGEFLLSYARWRTDAAPQFLDLSLPAVLSGATLITSRVLVEACFTDLARLPLADYGKDQGRVAAVLVEARIALESWIPALPAFTTPVVLVIDRRLEELGDEATRALVRALAHPNPARRRVFAGILVATYKPPAGRRGEPLQVALEQGDETAKIGALEAITVLARADRNAVDHLRGIVNTLTKDDRPAIRVVARRALDALSAGP
jgi:hypothetical protein